MPPVKKYLTVHGHFYQPPRENPWLEYVEYQDSASPYHDWNARVTAECYAPNSVSKIVDGNNRILDLVNNYSQMSFNFGPTLMSWLEKFSPNTYERIIKADVDSSYEHNGHGNAIAQVYNHIIMPLANKADKYTQVNWGINDFRHRFGRDPEGMWLAETACDDETMEVLADCGIKFTILSPHQAESFRKIGEKPFIDAAKGNIDTTRSYRYYIKSDKNREKYIDIFFYNASISQAVAFEELLKDSGRFIEKLKTGISKSEERPGLTNIATDGESYGHHTKFGEMALAYALRIKAHDEGFTITNYGEFLELYPPEYEVELKTVSAWSCCHGVGRWKEDCGCSTGGAQGWNQKWRKPLREALDRLRDNLIEITEREGRKYFKNVWEARNAYINVILDRSEMSLKIFSDKQFLPEIDGEGKINALKLMEIQRQAMLMYTSCGWFFNEISGIETTQIMKYAARAIQYAADFTEKDLESEFLETLREAKSNIPGYGTGKDIYAAFVRPCVMTSRQITGLWAITSLYEDYDRTTDLYCYEITKYNTKKVSKGSTTLLTGRLEVKSKITTEKSDVMFALLQYSGGDFHCAVREFDGSQRYTEIMKNLIQTYQTYPPTETIRMLDENFGREYYTFRDIFTEERQKILKSVLKHQTDKFRAVYREVYDEGKGSILHMKNLGLSVPEEFKLAARYTLSVDFNNTFSDEESIPDENAVQSACDINAEAKSLGLQLDKTETCKYFSRLISDGVHTFTKNYEPQRLDKILELLNYSELLGLNPDITEAQNTYFTRIYSKFSELVLRVTESGNLSSTKETLLKVLKLGEKLNINTEFYRNMISKATESMKFNIQSTN